MSAHEGEGAPDYLRTCWCDSATFEDDDGVLRCWDCAGLAQQTSPTPPAQSAADPEPGL